MKKEIFLENQEVQKFIVFLANEWASGPVFNAGVHQYENIQNAFNQYSWPFNVSEEPILLASPRNGSTFHHSSSVLNELKEKIRISYEDQNDEQLHLASRAVLKWGGVLGTINRGNLAYLTNNNVRNILNAALNHWNRLNMNLIGCSAPIQFKSNAGFTKIYSLFFDAFVIYDSRVGAALSHYLIKYFGNDVPIALRINIPPGRIGANHSQYKRNANPAIFGRTNAADHRHYESNVKASWLLNEVIAVLNLNKPSQLTTLRQLEAALFIIGKDVSQGRV